MTSMTLDERTTEAFAAKMLATLNGAALALMTSLGHRTGLFDTLTEMPPASSQAIADAAGLSERYVREWLAAMTTGGILEHDPEADTYWLPPEHAAVLTRAAGPNNLASPMQWIAVLGGVEDEVMAAFRHGKGVPYASYRRFHAVMAEESDQTTVGALEEHILPLVPGPGDRLTRGCDVLDVGCGRGHALLWLAGRFPASRFVGLDYSEEAIADATASARRQGLENLRFERADAARPMARQAFDLVTAFDAIHDQADPAAVLANIARALRPGGVFLMQDIKACSHVHGNRAEPLAPFLYTISCMHCMSVSLAAGGPGLGAAWGKELALTMLAAAGFRDVQVSTLPHDLINYYYIATPAR